MQKPLLKFLFKRIKNKKFSHLTSILYMAFLQKFHNVINYKILKIHNKKNLTSLLY